MHAYRCRECTLFRVDVLGDACSECFASLPSDTEPTLQDFSLTLKYKLGKINFGLGAQSATAPLVPPTAPAPAATLDYKSHAKTAAAFLINIPWTELKRFAIANGIPSPDMTAVHGLLVLYGNTP